MTNKNVNENNEMLCNKFEEMIQVMNRWIENLQTNKRVSSFFVRKGYKKIAIYGTSYLSQRLQKELENTDVSIDLIFDRNTIEKINEHKVDVIVVTSTYYYYEILEQLTQIIEYDCPIICIDDIVYKL